MGININDRQVFSADVLGFVLGWERKIGQGSSINRLSINLLVFLVGDITGVLLFLHLLGGDHCLLVNLALGHFGSRLDLLGLLLILALLLRTPAGAGVHAALVAVALHSTCTPRGAGIGDPCPDAGFLAFQKFPEGNSEEMSERNRYLNYNI